MGIGNKPTDTRVVMLNLTDITVAGSLKAEDVKEKLDKLDFNSVWTIGSNGTPELKMQPANTTASLFTRVVMSLKDFVRN